MSVFAAGRVEYLNHTPDRGFKTVAVFVAVAVAVHFSSRYVELSRFSIAVAVAVEKLSN